MSAKEQAKEMLEDFGVVINGNNPWDIQVHDERLYGRVFGGGTLALGESYMDGWWDVDDLSEFTAKAMRAGVASRMFRLKTLALVPHFLRHQLFNLQSVRRAFQVGKAHYDIGNDLYSHMLDARLTYSCGYWKSAQTLDEAQEAKLDLICRKVGLQKGDRVLDIGCGWGSFAVFAAERYGASVVGITVSEEQAMFARKCAQGLPVEIRVQDYREIQDGPYDHIVSVGMFEHVGYRNYRTYMKIVRKLLKEDGLFLLHTIGVNRTSFRAEPWFDTYIFPNGYVPSPALVGKAVNGLFVIEDWHNFGADYDATLTVWFKNFDSAWPDLRKRYGDRFYRMWKYYLLTMAGSFRARYTNLWQIVLSPRGVKGGCPSVR